MAGDELFVANHHANSITVHDINAAGDAPPKRSISGNLSNPAHRWVDNGELYVANANGGSVQVYNSSDYGNAVVPKRVLDVPARGLAVYGDELILPRDYNVTAGNTIYIYPKPPATRQRRRAPSPAATRCSPAWLACMHPTASCFAADQWRSARVQPRR